MSEIERLQAEYDVAEVKAEAIFAEYRAAREVKDRLFEQLRAAKAAAAPDHEWEGKIVTRQGTKKKGSGWHVSYVPVVLRGVVETYRDQNLHGTGLSTYGRVLGEPLVRILTATGKPGKKLQKLKSPRIDGAPIWTLEEGQ